MGPSETERAWAAGFFDGEGNVRACPTRSKLRQDGTPSAGCAMRVQVSQVEEGPLRRFHAVVGVGSVNGPYQHHARHHKPIYKWACTGGLAFAAVWNALGPYLSEPKREQFRRAWEDLRAHYQTADIRRNDPRRLPPEPV